MNKWIKASFLPAIMILLTTGVYAQKGGGPAGESKISLGVHADPLISWFSSDIDSVRNDGARPGFNFGLTINYFFGPNYAFSTGVNLISAGGRLVTRKETTFDVTSGIDPVVPQNTAIVYKIQYLAVPIGLKLQTNQIGYVTFFTDLGIDPKVVIGNKVDIVGLDNQKSPGEVRNLNISYHIMAGIEYAVGGNTAVVIGLGFENNFADITKDYTQDPFNQFVDRISHKNISVRLGVKF
ncbi:MAG TPA: porin family protein [Bacteroidales bacterium]|nr:porin family protein [Bacteroidales bacterium]